MIIFSKFIYLSIYNLSITRTMKFLYKPGPGTGRKSESVLEPESEQQDNLSQFWNRTRNRPIILVSSRIGTGTGRNMDPLQQCLIT